MSAIFSKLISDFVKRVTRPMRLYVMLHTRVGAKYWRGTYFGNQGKYFGMNELDKRIETYLKKVPGFFVELGANDGIDQSNTKYFELFKNWTGLLVEPWKPNYQACRRNRKKSTSVVHAACVSFAYKDQTVPLLFSDLMTITLSGESDIGCRESHAHSGKRFLDDGMKILEFLAPAKTLNAILDGIVAPNLIDFLSLDVEGSEIEVLKGVDHSKYTFDWILCECRDFQALDNYLHNLGYKFEEQLSGHDFLWRKLRT